MTETRLACATLLDPGEHCRYRPGICRFGPLPKSEGWQAAIAEADQESLSVKSAWVGTHHLLLALAGKNGGTATRVLAERGLLRNLHTDHWWVVGHVTWTEGAVEVLPSSNRAVLEM